VHFGSLSFWKESFAVHFFLYLEKLMALDLQNFSDVFIPTIIYAVSILLVACVRRLR